MPAMTTADVLVIVGALAAIVWVNWYFFFAARGTGPSGNAKGGTTP